jgi:hypothetical protein
MNMHVRSANSFARSYALRCSAPAKTAAAALPGGSGPSPKDKPAAAGGRLRGCESPRGATPRAGDGSRHFTVARSRTFRERNWSE